MVVVSDLIDNFQSGSVADQLGLVEVVVLEEVLDVVLDVVVIVVLEVLLNGKSSTPCCTGGFTSSTESRENITLYQLGGI